MAVKRIYKMCPKCRCARFHIPSKRCSQCSYAAKVKLQRHPLAFGITYWGPLPGTQDMHVQWDGPGTGLYLYSCDPTTARVPGMRVRHPSASGTYATLREAESAVHAFAEAGTS